MRSNASAALLIAVALAAAGCDNEQPLELKGREAELTFEAPGAKVPLYDVYPVFEDTNGDDVPDGETSFYCVDSGETAQRHAPWPFGVKVRVLRDGDISPEVVVDSTVYPPNFADLTMRNIAEYDTTVDPGAADPLNPVAITVTGRCSIDTEVPCAPGKTTCPGQTCLEVGTCDGDPAQECFKNPPDFPAVWIPYCFQNTWTPCDCRILSDASGEDLGFCCTPELDQGPNGECNANKFGRCTKIAVGCQPGCEELNAGVQCSGEPEPRVFKFGPARRLSATNRELLAIGSNIIADLDPGQAPTPDPPGGVCPGFDLGDSGIMGQGQPLRVSLKKGDVLLVEGTMLNYVPPGIAFVLLPEPGYPTNVNVTLRVDGESVIPKGSILSTLGTSTANPTAIDFSFMAR